MKKKLIATILMFIILITQFMSVAQAIVEDLTRENGIDLRTIANEITDDIWLEEDYSAYSQSVEHNNIKMYNYETTQEKQSTGTKESILYKENPEKYYLYVRENEGLQELYYVIRLAEDDTTLSNVATILYKGGLVYEGETYDIKLNINQISKQGNESPQIRFYVGARNYTEGDELNESTYIEGIKPRIGVSSTSNTKVSIDVEYIIIDSNGHEINISGVFGITDIDLNQGVFLNDYVVNNQNVYMTKYTLDSIDTINYKNYNSGTYIYSTTSADNDGAHAYILIRNKSRIPMTFTWEQKRAYSTLVMENIIHKYKKIDTVVIGGTITPKVTKIKDGEEKTITYEPNNPATQYLKSIKIDGQLIELTNNNNSSYTFSNITKDHKIEVEYANKYKVEFDSKGGAPTPTTEYVYPNELASEPTTNPSKTGYTFNGWNKDNKIYNFETPVTQDILLEAKWTPVIYNITYVLNGGTNDKDNPNTYTIEDTVDFQPATREGYDFIGWYEDESFVTPIDGISNRTGDVTVYAKWEAKADIPYKVKHYKETTAGKYELAVIESLTAKTDSEVTAEAKKFPGYYENTTTKNRIPTGIVKADGSLVLKLYYDKNEYTVTFDPKNNTEIPSQTVDYKEKAVEPTKPKKEGYDFEYWYYINEDGKEVRYNFDDPVTQDIDLIGKWEKTPTTSPKDDEGNNKPSKDNTKTDTIIPYTGSNTKTVFMAIMILNVVTIILGKKYFEYNKIK